MQPDKVPMPKFNIPQIRHWNEDTELRQSATNGHCEERSDEAISQRIRGIWRLLRCARNDGYGSNPEACKRLMGVSFLNSRRWKSLPRLLGSAEAVWKLPTKRQNTDSSRVAPFFIAWWHLENRVACFPCLIVTKPLDLPHQARKEVVIWSRHEKVFANSVVFITA
jgi:hypothetical protein